MKIILIDRRTIRENPEHETYNRPTPILVPMLREITVSFETDFQHGLDLFEDKDNRFIATSIEPLIDTCTVVGEVINPSFLESIKDKPKLVVSISGEAIKIVSVFAPSKYIYEYQNTKLVCEDCKKSTPYNKIKQEELVSDESYNMVDVCPHCGGYNSFEDYQLENINDVKL